MKFAGSCCGPPGMSCSIGDVPWSCAWLVGFGKVGMLGARNHALQMFVDATAPMPAGNTGKRHKTNTMNNKTILKRLGSFTLIVVLLSF